MVNLLSDSHIHWVKPILPTTLGDMELLPVPGGDKYLVTFDATWVFPGALCINKLKSSLALTLRDYPHTAGRLSCDPKTQEWRIRLTSDGVPITVGSTNLPSVTDEWFYNNELHPDIVDRLPTSFHLSELGYEQLSHPMVRFKLTIWEKVKETSLSVAWCHILGDAMTHMEFMHTWSNYYQDILPVKILTFEKFLNPVPTIERHFVYDTFTQVPQLGVHYKAEMCHELLNEMQSKTSRVDIKLTLVEIMAIHNVTKKNTEKRISTMDSLIAYLVTVLNRTEDVPIQRIANIIDYRGAKQARGSSYIPPPKTSVGNNIVTIHSKLASADRNTSIGSIAEVIREQITRARDPENLRRIVALSDELFNRAAEAGHLFWWFPFEGAVGVNNTLKVPVHDQHFGYPDCTRFHMYNVRERYLRIWPANPVKLSDGTWKTYVGGADISFRVKHARRDLVIKTIKEDLKHMMTTYVGGNVARL